MHQALILHHYCTYFEEYWPGIYEKSLLIDTQMHACTHGHCSVTTTLNDKSSFPGSLQLPQTQSLKPWYNGLIRALHLKSMDKIGKPNEFVEQLIVSDRVCLWGLISHESAAP